MLGLSVRLPLVLVLLATLLASACAGSASFTPGSGSQSSFLLAPSSIDLTPDTPTDAFNGQGDTAGVSYTATASSACSTSTGSIVVGGNGVAELDVGGSPLIFTVAAVGATPPATCTIAVSGSDSSSATVTVNYSDNPVIDIPDS